MAASKKEGIMEKEKRAATCISKPHGKRTSSGSTEKQIANHLNKSTKSTSSQVAATATTKNVKTIGADQITQSQRPNTLRRSFSSTSSTTTAPPHKPTIIKSASFNSPAPPHKPTITKSASFSLTRVAKNTVVGKPSTLSSSSMTRTRNACPTTKRGTTALASKRTPITTRGKKEAKYENKENLDHQVDNKEIPKADEGTQQHSPVVDVDSVEDEQKRENETLDDISNEVPRIEEMEDKFDGSDKNDRHVVDKENDSKEEIKKENDPREETTKIEIHEDEVVEEKNDEGIEEEANSVAKSRIEAEAAQGEKETVEEEENWGCKRQVEDEEEQGKKETENGKKESPTGNRNVVEERGKQVEERKNSVRALVGAFETHR